ncbi:retention module-containing protein, partial [Pseudomonas sp. 2FG]|uniref:retention module-containing protein n=1 Tax=Pseudomonas sp. 2FG TaxID=2502191 RepID=UPI0010F90863
MATLIGVVSQVVGEVYAVAGDGARRLLTEGDRVFAGEQLVTGAAGAVAVTLRNGQELTLGRDSSLALDEQMIAAGHDSPPYAGAALSAVPSDQELTDVEKLQAAIEAGVDPTLEGEATAAGPRVGGAANAGGGHSFVVLDAVGGSVEPVIGFPTVGLNRGAEFPDPEPVAASEPVPADVPDFLPEAANDNNSIAEDAVAAITGNVLDNDVSVDLPISFVAWGSTAASFGTFTDTGNGTYSYSLNNANPAVQALDSGQSLSETFSYTMQDADGDTASASLTLTITGSNDGPQLSVDPGNEGGNDQVFEAGLATGSNAAGNGEFATGTFRLSDADGLDDLQSVTLNGTTVALGSLAGSVFAGSNGSLTITAYDSATGVASYSYELTSPTSDGAGIETDVFSLTVSDGTASSAPASLVIEILDDVPNAADEGISIVQGALSVLIGNVLSNDLHANGQAGADSPTSFVAWSSTAANFGSFSDTGGGSGSYSLDNLNLLVQALDSGQSLTETFSYSMQDADGDTASASLTLTITGRNDTPQITVDPGNQGANDQVFEAGLAAGSNAASNSEFATGTFSLSDADGLDDLQSVTLNGTTVALASLVGSVFAGTNGSLTITAYDSLTGVASYSYELTSPTSDGLG